MLCAIGVEHADAEILRPKGRKCPPAIFHALAIFPASEPDARMERKSPVAKMRENRTAQAMTLP